MAICLPAYVATFSGQFYFRRSYFFILLQSNYFRSSTFFDELLFQNSHFFAAVIFSEQLLFQSETSTEPPLENRKFFRVVTFWNSYLSGGGIVQNEDIYRRDTFLKQVRSIKCFRRATFLKKRVFQQSIIPHYPLSSGELPFQTCYFFKRRYLLQQLSFQK